MKAAVLKSPASIASRPLEIRDIPVPTPAPGQILLRVRACGVCRTDLHVVEGELKPLRDHVIPGHQIVGEAADSNGARFGVTWMAGIDGTCEFCRRGEENLCDSPVFTGYTVDGGYAEFAVARSSVTNVTRTDARDFLQLASEIGLRPKVTVFKLEQANEALLAIKNDAIDGAAVLVP